VRQRDAKRDEPGRKKAVRRSNPLTNRQQLMLQDFVLLMETALNARACFIDPRQTRGGECRTDAEIEMLRKQFAPQLEKLERALLKLADRAAPLRDLMRPDSEPRRALEPGVFQILSKEPAAFSNDEVWQTAVAWIERALEQSHPKAHDKMVAAVQQLAVRKLVTSSELERAHEKSKLRAYVRKAFAAATSQRAPRGRKFAITWLGKLTGVSATTIRAAVKLAEAPRSFFPLGTTLAQREVMERDMAAIDAHIDREVRAGRMSLFQPQSLPEPADDGGCS
jgi:hypothetical protein